MSGAGEQGAGGAATLGDLGEARILAEIFARLTTSDAVLVGPGDDTALLAVSGPVLATTDAMVLGRDWLDEWSTPQDVGVKVVMQNLADLAAMGGTGTGLLVTLVAPPWLPARWAHELTAGIAEVSAATGVPLIGGDLSSSDGAVVVSVTALGELAGRPPVLRSGAEPRQEVAVSGSLGRSAAGLEILRRRDGGWSPPGRQSQLTTDWVRYHCRPDPDLTQGPAAAAAGATAMLDLSDGLVRDGGRIAAASAVRIELTEEVIVALAGEFAPVLGEGTALECVLSGGEEHSLLATFPAGTVPAGWTVLGRTRSVDDDGAGVWWRGARATGGGWDHFGG